MHFYFFFAGNFTCLEVIFKFRRRLGYYLFHTYIPTCLIVMMSWISFWIKPEAVPARVTLGVTSLLTLSTQHANSQKSLPPVSYIKVYINILLVADSLRNIFVKCLETYRFSTVPVHVCFHITIVLDEFQWNLVCNRIYYQLDCIKYCINNQLLSLEKT